MSFDTEVELSLTVPRSELRSVRSDIESSLGDMSLGVSASGGGGGGASGTGGQSRQRRMFRWARSRTRDMETTVELLESIDENIEDGGGGGGGGGTGGLLGAFGLGRAAGTLGSAATGAASTAASAGASAASGLGLGGAAALGAPLLGAAGGTALLLATGRNMEAMEDFEQERQRREEVWGDRPEGQLGPEGGNQDLVNNIGETSNIDDTLEPGDGTLNPSETLIDLASGNIDAPQWATNLVSGQFTAPEWVNMLISANTPTEEQTPTGIPTSQVEDIPGRVQINFENTIESEFGMSPQELRDRIEEVSEEKAEELRRELARATGRGEGGTPIP